MNEDLYYAFEECLQTGELVGFYPWTDFDALLVGKVLSLDRVGVEFELVNPGGTFDENKRYLLVEIHAIERGGTYLDGLTYLYNHRETLGLVEAKGKCCRSASRIRETLQWALNESQPVRLRRKGDQHHMDACVIRLEEAWIEVQQIRDGGVLDACHTFRIELITSLQTNSLTQMADAALVKYRAARVVQNSNDAPTQTFHNRLMFKSIDRAIERKEDAK